MGLLWFLLVFQSFYHLLLADQIYSASLGGAFGPSSREPKFKIEFHPEGSPFYPEGDLETVMITKKDGRSYLCYLPKEEKSRSRKSVIRMNTSQVVVDTEQPISYKTPDELLEVLKDRCFIRQEAWWSYEFCYQKTIRQLHLEDDKVAQEFVLGVYDEEATFSIQKLSDASLLKSSHSEDASQRYHVQKYTNGTICDLTNQPRETEVRFVCSESRATITSITELSTCKYALTVQVPLLCKHPLFQEVRPRWHTINCNELPKEKHAEVESDTLPKEKESEAESLGEEDRDTQIVMVAREDETAT